MTSTKPEATPATITIAAESLRALFTALAAELRAFPPPVANDDNLRKYYHVKSQRAAGVASELEMLASGLDFPTIFDRSVAGITEMSVRDVARPVDYEVKEAGK